MSSQDFPSTGLLGVPLRANSILQARVRTAQFEDLEGRRRGGLLKGLMFVHLKKDLESMPVDWIDSQDPSILPRPDQLTSYGVDKGVQRCLAAIRTDLDSFSEAEAYALMTSAYLMTETALAAPIIGFPVPPAPRPPVQRRQRAHLAVRLAGSPACRPRHGKRGRSSISSPS